MYVSPDLTSHSVYEAAGKIWALDMHVSTYFCGQSAAFLTSCRKLCNIYIYIYVGIALVGHYRLPACFKTGENTVKASLFVKVPITPKNFCGPNEWLCHAEQNFQKIFVFGQNWNFL